MIELIKDDRKDASKWTNPLSVIRFSLGEKTIQNNFLATFQSLQANVVNERRSFPHRQRRTMTWAEAFCVVNKISFFGEKFSQKISYQSSLRNLRRKRCIDRRVENRLFLCLCIHLKEKRKLSIFLVSPRIVWLRSWKRRPDFPIDRHDIKTDSRSVVPNFFSEKPVRANVEWRFLIFFSDSTEQSCFSGSWKKRKSSKNFVEEWKRTSSVSRRTRKVERKESNHSRKWTLRIYFYQLIERWDSSRTFQLFFPKTIFLNKKNNVHSFFSSGNLMDDRISLFLRTDSD